MLFVLVLCIIGFAISLYSFFIEQKIKKNVEYKPICDISDKMSCTKPILSPYGKMFGVSNALLGIFFYAAIFVLAWLKLNWIVFLGALTACVVSVFLGWILYSKIKTYCLLCTSLYVINFLLLVFSYFNL